MDAHYTQSGAQSGAQFATQSGAEASVQPHAQAGLDCSIVIPVYNGAGVITRCLDGMAAQSLATDRFEVIVVDDGSTDDTLQVVTLWGSTHPEVALHIVSQKNTGPAGARNHGARVAQGRILLYTDADCTPWPGWAAAFQRAFDAADAPDAAMGAYRSRQTTPAALYSQLEFEERYRMLARRRWTDFIATYSAAYRRDVFQAVGGFESAMPKANNEDSELSYRLSQAGYRIAFVPDAIVEHEHDATWGDYLHTKIGRGFWRTIVYRRFPGKAVADSYTPQMLKLQLPLSLLVIVGVLGSMWKRSPKPLWLAAPFLASTIPMARVAWSIRSPALLWVPFGSWVRAIAFVIGVSQAIFSQQRDLLANGPHSEPPEREAS